MAELKETDGHTVVTYMARDYDSLLASMRELIPTVLPDWTDFKSEADFGNVLLELFAHMGDILSYYQDRVANESFLGTAQTRRSVIEHLRLIGYRLGTAAPASTTLTLSVPATFTGKVTIRKGDAFATKSQKDHPSIRFEYTQADRVIDTAPLPPLLPLPTDPVTNRKLITNIPVEEGRTVSDKLLGVLLGVSDGTPNQRFDLPQSPLILRPVASEEQENKDLLITSQLSGGTPVHWTIRESLAFSREGQTDFTVEIDDQDRATIIFGDGDFGKIPVAGSEIRATYRVGGGAMGNVPRNAIQTIVGATDLALAGGKVAASEPAAGGADRESIEHAVQHAPSVFRAHKRAVTAADYESLAGGFGGVGKVRARGTGWNTVTLFVAPAGGGRVSDTLRQNLIEFFEDKRPVSTQIDIKDMDYVPIYVSAEIGIGPYFSRKEIKQKVEAAAGAILDFNNVEFGKNVYLSKFYEVIEGLPEVEYVVITEFRRKVRYPCPVDPSDALDPLQPVAAAGRIVLCPNEIPIKPSNPDDPTDDRYQSGIFVSKVEGGYD